MAVAGAGASAGPGRGEDGGQAAQSKQLTALSTARTVKKGSALRTVAPSSAPRSAAPTLGPRRCQVGQVFVRAWHLGAVVCGTETC